ncbi:hypothetical protein [Paenibacillus polymyxa]|uniref:hypothetical protein n=1 Tax=Paenibacillus polymyxa TaxID=1406 RepID=UPI002AB3B7C7|nr:hypothetical protein [Paenibacillus polymyxa]MDY8021207.1 hypothetical protein [Paenibacillus polymyxa]
MTERVSCPRCGGNGRIEKYKHVQDGVCFECSGAGKVTQEEAQRIEKEIAKQVLKSQKAQENTKRKFLESLKKSWFNGADEIYVVNEINSFEIREQLKLDGAKFNDFKVWYFTYPNENYNIFKVEWDEVVDEPNDFYAIKLEKIIRERSNGNLRGK